MKTFYTPKLVKFYNYNFIKNKFTYVYVMCNVLTGAGKKNFKAKLIQVNCDASYSYMYYHSNF